MCCVGLSFPSIAQVTKLNYAQDFLNKTYLKYLVFLNPQGVIYS